MNVWIYPLIFGALAIIGLTFGVPKGQIPDGQPSIDLVRHAHNLDANYGALRFLRGEAYKATWLDIGDNRDNDSFVRKHVVFIDGERYLRTKTHPSGLRSQSDLITDGRAFRTAVEKGKAQQDIFEIDGAKTAQLRISFETFGLFWVLRLLGDPTTQAEYVGKSSEGWDRFRVKSGSMNFTLTADTQHLIRKMEIQNQLYEFGDIREVDGVKMAFLQHVTIGQRPVYDLVFTSIQLNVPFEDNVFQLQRTEQLD